MFGFLVGAACLGGLAAVLFSRPHRFGACHRPFYGGFGRRFALRAAFERLDTTPGQEKAIVAALDELRDQAGEVRSKLASSRKEVAAALRDEHFEPERVRGLVDGHFQDFSILGAAGATALGKIHEALDPEQRKRLARWLEAGPGFHFA